MNRPVPYIDLFGVAGIRKRFGTGWMVGEPNPRIRGGGPSVELRRVSHYPHVDDAVLRAFRTLEAHDVFLHYPPTLDGPENEVARLLAALTAGLLDYVPEIVRAGRLASGLSRVELGILARVNRSTVRRTEEALTDTKLFTAEALLRRLPS